MISSDLYSFFRRHVGIIMIGGAAITVAASPAWATTYVMVAWAALAVWWMAAAQWHTARASRNFGGRLLQFVFAPTPMGSLIDSLGKNGISPEDVQAIYLMSSDVNESLKYFVRGGRAGEPFAETMRRCPQMQVTIYGPCSGESSSPNGITVIKTRNRSLEHKNLIIAKNGRCFVWYEPYHNVKNGKHYFTRGAYLFEISEQRSLQLQQELAELPRKAA